MGLEAISEKLATVGSDLCMWAQEGISDHPFLAIGSLTVLFLAWTLLRR